MNKIQKIIISILAGVETIFYIATPLLLGILWMFNFPTTNFTYWLILVIILISTLFRAIKVGWMK